MVVNAMMVAMAAHSEEQAQTIYNVTSSLRNPASYMILHETGHRYFVDNPPRGKNGEPIRLSKMRFFSTVARLSLYMAIKYRLPLEVSNLVTLWLPSIVISLAGEMRIIVRGLTWLCSRVAAVGNRCFAW
jgi:fatty acyl-CoA reductase